MFPCKLLVLKYLTICMMAVQQTFPTFTRWSVWIGWWMKKKEFSTILRKTETTQCLNTAYSSSHRVGERFIQKSQQRYKPQSHISTNTGSGTCRQWRMFTLDTRGEISLLIAANTRENNLFFPHWPMPSSDPTTALSLPIAQPITYLAMCYGNLIITNTAKQNYCLISILKEYQW